MFEFILIIIAIENIADILTSVDLLDGARTWYKKAFPKLERLATCKYCQMFWLCLLFFCVWTPPTSLIMALAGHRLATLFSEFCERYLNRAPTHLFVQTTAAAESGSSQK